MSGIIYPQGQPQLPQPQTQGYAANHLWAQPWSGFSPSQFVGYPAQNLAMFGQAAQQPMGIPQQQPTGGNNYLAAILQALQGAQQQPQVQIPNPTTWQPGAGAAPAQAAPSAPISSLGQVQQPAAAAPSSQSAPAALAGTWLYPNG